MNAARRPIGDLLRLHNLSAVAREIGVDKKTINRWINGEAVPSGPNLLKIAQLLGVDPYEIDLPKSGAPA